MLTIEVLNLCVLGSDCDYVANFWTVS